MTPTPLYEFELEVKKLSRREHEDYVKQIVEGFLVVDEIKEFNDYVGSILKQKNQKVGRQVDYHIGDVVLYMKPHRKPKLTTRYYGPYVIYKVIKPHTYRLRNEKTGKKLISPINGELLFPYKRRGRRPKRIEDYWKNSSELSTEIDLEEDGRFGENYEKLDSIEKITFSDSSTGSDSVPLPDENENSMSIFDEHPEKISYSSSGDREPDDDVDIHPGKISYSESSENKRNSLQNYFQSENIFDNTENSEININQRRKCNKEMFSPGIDGNNYSRARLTLEQRQRRRRRENIYSRWQKPDRECVYHEDPTKQCSSKTNKGWRSFRYNFPCMSREVARRKFGQILDDDVMENRHRRNRRGEESMEIEVKEVH